MYFLAPLSALGISQTSCVPSFLQSQVSGLQVEPSMHGKELFSLDISCFYLLFWLAYHNNRVSDKQWSLGLLPIQLTAQDLPFSLQVFCSCGFS